MTSQLHMFVNGQAMRGGDLNPALAGATFIGEVRTAARYRFYSVRDEFPGLFPVQASGAAIAGEIYAVSYARLRDRLLPREPRELELTVIELEDGSGALSMRMRDEAIDSPGVIDITEHGGWRNYLRHLDAGTSPQ